MSKIELGPLPEPNRSLRGLYTPHRMEVERLRCYELGVRAGLEIAAQKCDSIMRYYTMDDSGRYPADNGPEAAAIGRGALTCAKSIRALDKEAMRDS